MPTERTPQEQAIWEEIIYGPSMPMGPTETSWASWKNGGGPHQDDIKPNAEHTNFAEVALAADTSVERTAVTHEPLTSGERFALLVTMSAIKNDPSLFDGGGS